MTKIRYAGGGGGPEIDDGVDGAANGKGIGKEIGSEKWNGMGGGFGDCWTARKNRNRVEMGVQGVGRGFGVGAAET